MVLTQLPTSPSIVSGVNWSQCDINYGNQCLKVHVLFLLYLKKHHREKGAYTKDDTQQILQLEKYAIYLRWHTVNIMPLYFTV